ncbi:hypothetical protein Sjap_003357 [Stephania japonica]|uniref:SET domain-containing protein n=1 Tax=Stephania japonica TaxID=461633 RepID=A0AAP0KNK7_9MAGN
MEATCDVDAELSDQISALIKPPSPDQGLGFIDESESLCLKQEYFEELLKSRNCVGLKVKPESDLGKGVYADVEFGEGELVLKDQMLVGAQHSSNKVDCLVCSHCFCFVGSVELQIGRKLCLQELGLSSSDECASSPMDGIHDSPNGDHDNLGSCSSSDFKEKVSLPKEIVASLMNGQLALPYSERFALPSVVPCPGGCGEAYYCSKLCAGTDWELSHSLLCTGKGSQAICREALLKFVGHANETNDIFLLAAKAIAFTILRYKKLKLYGLQGQQQDEHAKQNGQSGSEFSLLLEVWKPMSMGFKRRWWECVALPEDVDCCDEVSFRKQIRDLASMSLQLLKQAIFDKECAPCITVPIEISFLHCDLVVASPVEDYFLYIDDLPPDDKETAEMITRPILDALGDDYSVCCQGSAFFPLQSCMNHSCQPNAKAFKRDEDRDGQATIIALRTILKGEEITVSYIDESLPLEDRRTQLADYGFKCRRKRDLNLNHLHSSELTYAVHGFESESYIRRD